MAAVRLLCVVATGLIAFSIGYVVARSHLRTIGAQVHHHPVREALAQLDAILVHVGRLVARPFRRR